MSAASGSEGIVCLANDGIVDGLIALCESLRANSPGLPLTIIPFDASLTRTREVVERFGHRLLDDPSLEAMDDLGRRYWPGESFRTHAMRKFCAFSGPYDRFLFLDADIVVLRPLDAYFELFRRDSADLLYFQTDISMVYVGPLLDEMAARGSVGFQTGVFMGRRGTVTTPMLEQAFVDCEPHRGGFVDILEQTFLNYVVDTASLTKLDAHQALPGLVDGWAGMRLKRKAGGFVLADARTRESGRPVALIHWGGYAIAPLMPYRSTFLTYRLAGAGRIERIRYRVLSLIASLRGVSYRTPLRLAHRWRGRGRNWLAARGYQH